MKTPHDCTATDTLTKIQVSLVRIDERTKNIESTIQDHIATKAEVREAITDHEHSKHRNGTAGGGNGKVWAAVISGFVAIAGLLITAILM